MVFDDLPSDDDERLNRIGFDEESSVVYSFLLEVRRRRLQPEGMGKSLYTSRSSAGHEHTF